MPDRVAKKVVTAWTERLEPLYRESSLAWWASNTLAAPRTPRATRPR